MGDIVSSYVQSLPCPCIESQSLEPSVKNNKLIDADKLRAGFATSHLLATILHKFFESDSTKCEFIKADDYRKDMIPILDHILLYGGSVRDLMLNKTSLKDLDIVVNTRELSKLHLLHLEKYHNTLQTQNDDVECIFWRHYLNKFNQSMKTSTINENSYNFRLMNTFRCNYTINAKWISQIILNSNEFVNAETKYFESSEDEYHCACFQIKIKDDVYYNNINIGGQHIDLFDPGHQFLHIKDLSKSNVYDIDDTESKLQPRNLLKHKISIKMSADKFSTRESMGNVLFPKQIEENKSEIIKIKIPIHSTSVIDLLDRTDFSFNAVIITLKAIYNRINVDNLYDLNIWQSITTNASSERDSLDDIKNRIIRSAYKDPLKTIKYNFRGQQRYFFRLIKFGARYYDDWTIDQELVDAVIKTYDDWFNIEIMNKEQIRTFCNDFIHGYLEQLNENTWNYDARFKVMAVIMFHQRMINMLNASTLFKNVLEDEIKNMKDDYQKKQFVQICIDHKYPLD